MRVYLVSGLGLLLGLTAAWAGNGDAAAPVPSGASGSAGGRGVLICMVSPNYPTRFIPRFKQPQTMPPVEATSLL